MTKKLIFGILLFFLFYFEPVSIFGIKFAHLWKLFFLSGILFFSRFIIYKDKLTSYSLLYSIKFLFTSGTIFIGQWADGLYMMIRGLSIPIFNNFIIHANKKNTTILELLNFTAKFSIISAVPFFLNIITPISSGYQLDGYGSDNVGFIGIFQNPHGAAIILAHSLLIVLYSILTKKGNFVINLVIILIGCFALYKTYVRTGFAMFLVGALILLILIYGFKRLYKLIPIGLIAVISIVYIYKNDSALQGRIKQENIYGTNKESSIDKISSGRLTLSFVNLQNWIESDVFSFLFGLGYENSTDLMYEDIKQKKMSHNGFVDALVHNGITGFVLFLSFLYWLNRKIVGNKKSKFYPLGLASFASYILFNLFQGGNIFLVEIQIICIVYIISNTNEHEILLSS